MFAMQYRLFQNIIYFIVCLGLIFVLGLRSPAYAAISYTVHNDEPMYLKNGITNTQTTSILFTGPLRNGTRQTFTTQSGGILELSTANRSYVELIFYTSASVNQTTSTKDVTLSGVTRGICWNNARDSNTFGQCENGRTWAKGTKGTLVDTYQLFNFSAKRDTRNDFTGSGSIVCYNRNQPCINVGRWTTTEISTLKTLTGGSLFFNYSTSQLGFYDGSNKLYIATTTGSIANAGYANRGEVELATPAEMLNATASGSSNAPLVPAVKDLVKTGGIGTNTGKILVLSGGLLDPSVLGLNTGSGRLLQIQGRGEAEWRTIANLLPFTHEATVTTASADVGASSTATGVLLPVWTGTGVDANTLAVGSVIKVNAGGSYDRAAGNLLLQLVVGGNIAAQFEMATNASGTTSPWYMNAEINVRSIGAAGSLIANGSTSFSIGPGNLDVISTGAAATGEDFPSTSAFTVNTNNAIHIAIQVRFTTGNASNYVNMQTGSIWVSRP